MSFFAMSKTAEKMLKEFEGKIEKAKKRFKVRKLIGYCGRNSKLRGGRGDAKNKGY